ncbi:MAG: hypothetical protein H0X40_19010 [Chthoniobacterales bacterium]|nr:hypothetical protein [Chthoniobacterales bacterium]
MSVLGCCAATLEEARAWSHRVRAVVNPLFRRNGRLTRSSFLGGVMRANPVASPAS